MSKITDEMIEYVGILSKLKLNEEEKKQAKADMEKMLEYIDILKEVNTDNIEGITHIGKEVNIFREDKIINEDERKMILKNAPKTKDGMFSVPKTVG